MYRIYKVLRERAGLGFAAQHMMQRQTLKFDDACVEQNDVTQPLCWTQSSNITLLYIGN